MWWWGGQCHIREQACTPREQRHSHVPTHRSALYFLLLLLMTERLHALCARMNQRGNNCWRRVRFVVRQVRATDPSVTDAGGDVKDPNKMEDALTTLESHGKESKQLLDQFCQNASERLHARIDDDPGQGSEMLKSLLAQASNNLKESFSNDLRTVTRSLTAGLTTLTLERSPSELSASPASMRSALGRSWRVDSSLVPHVCPSSSSCLGWHTHARVCVGGV